MHEDNTKSRKVIISSIALSSLLLLCGCKSHKKNEELTKNNTINSIINSTIKDDALYVNLNNTYKYTEPSSYKHPAVAIRNLEYYNQFSNQCQAILPDKIRVKKRMREKKYLDNKKYY